MHSLLLLLPGVAPRVVKRTLQTALVWTLYEELLPRTSDLCSWVVQLVLDNDNSSSSSEAVPNP